MCDRPNAQTPAQRDGAAFGSNLTPDQTKKRGFACAIAADKADPCPTRYGDGGFVKEKARAEGAIILAELKDQASADAAAITAKAHQQIEAERLAAIPSLRSEVGQLALDLAGRVIGEQVKDAKSSSAIVDRFLSDIEKNDKGK